MAFKRCGCCGCEWADRDAFLSDPEVVAVGYQAHFVALTEGLFLFQHNAEGCATSMAVKVAEFADLHDGPVFRERRTGGPDCPGFCLQRTALATCPAQCECAFVREILVMIRNWPKRPVAEVG